jgi:AAHS family 4-hydroxybenzoate transporter-like MFS transporter
MTPPTAPVDIGSLLDEGRWSLYQKLLVVATALAIVLDGLDNQVIGAAVPLLMREWGKPRAAVAPLLASGLVGMMIGGAGAGLLGDRLGRRVALLGSVVWFGVLTASISLADGVSALSALRFLAGLGIGGAMPSAAALASEYVPRRHRPFAVTLTIACVPLGGTLAGLVGAEILPRFGWRPLFLVSGALPLALAAVLWKALPESPRYLARQRQRWPELAALLCRLGHHVPKDAAFVDTTEKAVRASARELLLPELRRDTLALYGSFFFCLLSVYVIVNWVPSALTGAGFGVGAASHGLTAFNVGGFLGAVVGAVLIARLGSRRTMPMMAAGAIASAAALGAMAIGAQSTLAILVLLTGLGGFINAVQTAMYALAAHVYPTSIRATGVGGAVAFGLFGGVLSTHVGFWALESGGASRLFALLAAAMTVVLVALASVRWHIPPGSAARRG